MKKTALAAAAAFAVASGAMTIQASAADLDFMPPPPAPFQPVWSGFYVGGHVGYGETQFDFRQDVDVFDATGAGSFNTFRSSVSPNGLVGGVQGGYNWQIRSLVLGIEGDVSFTDWGQSTSVFDSDFDTVAGLAGNDYAFGTSSGDVDLLASVRGRVGWAMGNVLLYGTGGVAWADAEARAYMEAADATTVTEWSGKKSLNDLGLVAGGGFAWVVIPQTFSVGVEGLYYFFKDKKTLIDDTINFNGGQMDVRATAELHDTWVVRARADFHF